MPGLIRKKILLCGFYGKPSVEINHKAIEEMFNTDVIKPINLSHMGLKPIGFRDLPKPEIKPLKIEFELSEQQRIDIQKFMKGLSFEQKEKLEQIRHFDEDLYNKFTNNMWCPLRNHIKERKPINSCKYYNREKEDCSIGRKHRRMKRCKGCSLCNK